MPAESAVVLHDLAFTYEGSSDFLFQHLDARLPPGFTGVVGANGAGKTTLLRLIAGELRATAGHVRLPGEVLYCAQRTDDPPADLDAFLEDWDGHAAELRDRLAIAYDTANRWATLSHGERKRVQIAHALWRAPAVLAIDEPTNHIDADARGLLLAALRTYAGVGLLVSHDRGLLDELCTRTLWLAPPEARLFQGGYEAARAQRALERETRVRERADLVRAQSQLQAERVRRRERAAQEHHVRSRRGIDRHDHDAKFRIGLARLTDGKGGAALRQLDGRAQQLQARLDATKLTREYDTGIWLAPARARRPFLFALGAGELTIAPGRTLRHPALTMAPTERIAISGANGAGKTTLLRHLLQHLSIAADATLVMPQELDAAQSVQLLRAAQALPAGQLGHVMTIVSRLGSRPQRLLPSASPSPGEVRKLLLALGMANAPQLVVLDEPTNHLDVVSIEALESALDECPCGLLFVTHDARFRERLATTQWHMRVDPRGNAVLEIV